jgi:asparagine synthase (glutamine-hydrolysing)
MEIFTKNSAKCTIFQRNDCNNFSSLMQFFQKVPELGFSDAIVRDGADELFGGYSFTWKMEDSKEWKEKRDSMCAQWTFVTESLDNMHGFKSHSLYMELQMVEWFIENTQQSDCIDKRPIQLVYGSGYQDYITGKIILRQEYEAVASCCQKNPIEVRSGITVIGHDEYWKDLISDREFETETRALFEHAGFVLSSKSNLANFWDFEECFGGQDGNETIAELPNKKWLKLCHGCKGCCF